MTPIAPVPGTAARLALARDFAGIGEFFRDHPDAIVPDQFRYQYPVPSGLDQPARVEWVRGVAGSWGGAPVLVGPDGTRYCEVRRGAVSVVAAVAPAGHHCSGSRQDDLDRRAPFGAVLRGAA